MTEPKTRSQLLRSRSLQLRREAIELQSSPQPRLIKWLLGKYLAFASRGIEHAQRMDEKQRQDEQHRIENEQVRATLRAQALGKAPIPASPGIGPAGDDPSRS